MPIQRPTLSNNTRLRTNGCSMRLPDAAPFAQASHLRHAGAGPFSVAGNWINLALWCGFQLQKRPIRFKTLAVAKQTLPC